MPPPARGGGGRNANNQSSASPSSSLGNTLTGSPSHKYSGGGGNTNNNPSHNNPSMSGGGGGGGPGSNNLNRPQSPNEIPPVAAEWLSEMPSLSQLPIPPPQAQQGGGNITPSPTQQQLQVATAVSTATNVPQQFNTSHPLHPHYNHPAGNAFCNNPSAMIGGVSASTSTASNTNRAGNQSGSNTTASSSNQNTSRTNNADGTTTTTTASVAAALHPSILSIAATNNNVSSPLVNSPAAAISNHDDDFGNLVSSQTLVSETATNNFPLQPQQKQQLASLPTLSADHLARSNQLTLLFQDKVYTWGGWFGCGTEKPPKELVCCYDLNGNTSVAAAAAAAAQQQSSSPSSPGSNNSAWSNYFIKTSTNNGTSSQHLQQIHPASTQFAWAEIAPGVAILFGGWTGTTRTNTVTLLCLTQEQQQTTSTAAPVPSRPIPTPPSTHQHSGAALALPKLTGPVVAKWKTLQTSGDRPPALTFASGVAANGGKRFAIYGGNGADGPSSDVYVLDLTTLMWRQMPSAGCPPKRSSHTACVVRDSLMVVFGGRGVSDLASFSLNGESGGGGLASLASLQNTNNDNINKSSKLDSKAQQALLAAQQNQQQQALPNYANTPLLMNDFGVFDLSSSHWLIGMRVEGMAPPARYGHTAIATAQNHIIVFGGIGDQGNLLNDVWVVSFDKPGAIVWRSVTHTAINGSGSPRSDTPLQTTTQSQQQQQNTVVATTSTSSSSSLLPYQPTPRTGAGLLRVTKSIVAVVAGRIGSNMLEPVKPNSSKFPSSASVHFLDISKIVADELFGRSSGANTPHP